MDGGFINPNQAGAVGGGDKPAGATGENTFQHLKEHQLIVLVKPGKDDAGFGESMAAAGGLLDSVTSGIEGAVSAVEDAAASIPGLDLFIKEKKGVNDSEKEYSTEFKEWDDSLKDIEKNIQELFKENKILTFGFKAKTSDERKKEGEKLADKIKEALTDWSGYTTWVHIIALGQGGNIVNECSQKLADSFQGEKWLIKSVFYVATPLYKTQHLFENKCLKGTGKLFSVCNQYDLTHQAIQYFEPNDELIKYITDCNSNLLKLMTGKLKMRVVKLLALLLKGVTIGTGAGIMGPIKDLVNGIKDEIGGTIEDVSGMIEQMMDDVKDIIDLKDIPDFKQFLDGFSNIPNECKAALMQELEDLMKKIEDGAKSANLQVGLADLTKFLNCLCPLTDHLKEFLQKLSQNPEAKKAMSQKILDKTKIEKVLAAQTNTGTIISISSEDPYHQKVMDAAKEKQLDKVKAFISSVQDCIKKASAKEETVSKMSDKEKQEAADAIYLITYPMLASKKEFIEKLLDLLSGFVNIKEMMSDIKLQSLAASAGDAMKGLYLSFPPEKLKNSIAAFDTEFDRIKNFFGKREFNLKANSLYFMYNANNIAMKKMYDALKFEIDNQTGYAGFMHQKGYDNEFPLTGKHNYAKSADGEVKNVMPTKELPQAQPG